MFEPSPEVAQFYAELMERLPPPEAFTKEELDGEATPWADSPEASDRLVWLSVRWGADDEDLDTIRAQLRTRGAPNVARTPLP